MTKKENVSILFFWYMLIILSLKLLFYHYIMVSQHHDTFLYHRHIQHLAVITPFPLLPTT